MNSQLLLLRKWYAALPVKEQWMVLFTGILVVITLFYILLWEPIFEGLDNQKQLLLTQNKTLFEMQQYAAEAASMKTTGNVVKIRDADKPVNLVVDQSLQNAGLKPMVKKLESSDNDGARVTLNDASFNQLLVWLNTLATYNNIHVVSANIERTEKQGYANARLTLQRP
jgi:general secretion pathway protein M